MDGFGIARWGARLCVYLRRRTLAPRGEAGTLTSTVSCGTSSRTISCKVRLGPTWSVSIRSTPLVLTPGPPPWSTPLVHTPGPPLVLTPFVSRSFPSFQSYMPDPLPPHPPVLALLTMEAPVSMHPDDVRDEKVKVGVPARGWRLSDLDLYTRRRLWHEVSEGMATVRSRSIYAP